MTEKELYNQLEEYDKTVIKLSKEIKELKETIDKAIKILESKKHCERLYGGVEGKTFTEQAINILKGEENE